MKKFILFLLVFVLSITLFSATEKFDKINAINGIQLNSGQLITSISTDTGLTSSTATNAQLATYKAIITNIENLIPSAVSSALSSAIGSTIQAYNANYVVDASYVHTDNNLTSALMSTYSGKQDALVSGTNIKTINGNSLLGSGGLTIDSGITTTDTPIQGDILYYNGSAYKLLQHGTDGQFLKTQGESANPIWSTPAGAGDTLAPATNSDNYVPQWDGANSKTLKNGLPAGGASGIATLDGSSKVVQDPANATATATASKIPIADGSGKLDTWLSDASDTVKGKVELATAAETTSGTDATRAVTPDALAGSDYGKRVVQVQLNDSTALTTSAKGYFRIPSTMNGYNLVSVAAMCVGASSSGAVTITVKNGATSMLSTNITIDQSETDTSTAATAAVIDTAEDDVATGNQIEVACSGAGTGVTYCVVELTFQLP